MAYLKAALLSSVLSISVACAGASLAQTDQSSSATPANDAPVTSGVVAQPSAAAAQSDSIDQQIAAWTQTPPATGDNLGKSTDAAPRQIHGQAGVSIGSNGYRSGYVATEIPIGQDSTLGIAVADTQFKPRHFGTVNSKSLALSLSIGQGGESTPAPCAGDTIRVDGQYMEPLWVAHARGAQLARDQMSCPGPMGVGPGPVGDAAE